MFIEVFSASDAGVAAKTTTGWQRRELVIVVLQCVVCQNNNTATFSSLCLHSCCFGTLRIYSQSRAKLSTRESGLD